MANETNLSGAQRAAIFLLGVGEEAATEVMRHMSAKEVQQVGEAMATISKLTNSQVEDVLAEFHIDSAEINPLGLEAPDFTRRVMTSADVWRERPAGDGEGCWLGVLRPRRGADARDGAATRPRDSLKEGRDLEIP